MALRGMFDTPEEAPEPLREHLVPKNGKYVLDVEGYATKEVLDEFRSNNRALKAQADALTAKLTEVETRYAGVDPAEYQTLKSGLPDTAKQIAEVERRLQQKYDAQFTQERQKAQEAETKFHRALIASAVASAAPKVGVHETAIEDLQARAASVFRVQDGHVVPFKGDEPLYSAKEPAQLMPVEEWLGGLTTNYPHYFKASSGGGATGGLTPGPGGRAVVPASDQRAVLANLEKIASGQLDVDLTA